MLQHRRPGWLRLLEPGPLSAVHLGAAIDSRTWGAIQLVAPVGEFRRRRPLIVDHIDPGYFRHPNRAVARPGGSPAPPWGRLWWYALCTGGSSFLRGRIRIGIHRRGARCERPWLWQCPEAE